MTNELTYTYDIYISASPEDVWDAFVQPEKTALWWEVRNTSDWKEGSTWQHTHITGKDLGSGDVIKMVKPSKMIMTFPAGAPTHLTINLEHHEGTVKLSVHHSEFTSQQALEVASNIWPAILSNLKTYLETGKVMATSPLRIVGA